MNQFKSTHTSSPALESIHSRQSSTGVLCAMMAFLTWGLSPIYWKSLRAIPAFEVLMHRIIWSFIFLIPVLCIRKQWPDFRSAIYSQRTILILIMTTTIVSCNWFLFIWAIHNNNVLQTSLGYFITPLVNVLLGTVFLKERLRLLQITAVSIAACAVFYLTVSYGSFPWVALSLAFTFGFYGLIRKIAPVSALVGLSVETLLLSIPATGYLIYLDAGGFGAFLHNGFKTDLLLMGAALVTALPLLLFTMGARRINLSTIGFLQYIAPSCTFLLAVFVYDEPLSGDQIFTFIMIWVALSIFSADSLRYYHRGKILR